MQLSHVFSDAVLSGTGFLMLGWFALRNSVSLASVWGLFFVPISLAAFFGALRFADVHENMIHISEFFQQLAATVGSCGLILGAFGSATQKRLPPRLIGPLMAAGFAQLVMARVFEVQSVLLLMPLAAMLTTVGIAIGAIAKGNVKIGVILVAAVVLSAAAIWTRDHLANREMAIDVFHYLMAAALCCFGLASQPQGPPTATASHND